MLTKNLCSTKNCICKEDYSPKKAPIIEYLPKKNNANRHGHSRCFSKEILLYKGMLIYKGEYRCATLSTNSHT